MKAYRSKKFLALMAVAFVGAVIALTDVFASRYGAAAGHTGGPANYGLNCAACHEFNQGGGRVEVLGVPQRYRPGKQYDLTIRITDREQAGAGFQISAEGIDGHTGSFLIIDDLRTQYAGYGGETTYVTHTVDGVDDAVANWVANGGSYEYSVGWQAPADDQGPTTFFAAGNAINDADLFFGDRYYATWATIAHAVPGDGDGDNDVDLYDFLILQQCFGNGEPIEEEACTYLDFDGDGTVSLEDVAAFVDAVDGPTATQPAGYVLGDQVRGGLLYDKWWKVNGAGPPAGEHPLYPPEGAQAGSSTFRCKECHGWDYKGVDGAYGSGSHYTGIGGVFGTTLSSKELFALLKADPAEVPNGHDMDAYGMTDADLWDVVKMTLEGVLDTDDYIDGSGAFIGDLLAGENQYNTYCIYCHGFDGTDINFGDETEPEYVGTVASQNPWEFLHKVRHGNPGAPMMGFELLHWDKQTAADVGVYAATLPTE